MVAADAVEAALEGAVDLMAGTELPLCMVVAVVTVHLHTCHAADIEEAIVDEDVATIHIEVLSLAHRRLSVSKLILYPRLFSLQLPYRQRLAQDSSMRLIVICCGERCKIVMKR